MDKKYPKFYNKLIRHSKTFGDSGINTSPPDIDIVQSIFRYDRGESKLQLQK